MEYPHWLVMQHIHIISLRQVGLEVETIKISKDVMPEDKAPSCPWEPHNFLFSPRILGRFWDVLKDNSAIFWDADCGFLIVPFKQCMWFRIAWLMGHQHCWTDQGSMMHIPPCSTVLEYLPTDPAKCIIMYLNVGIDRAFVTVLFHSKMCFHHWLLAVAITGVRVASWKQSSRE